MDVDFAREKEEAFVQAWSYLRDNSSDSLKKLYLDLDAENRAHDGEDFTEGYRTLKLGRVVGEPTAGWIIYTSNFSLVDGTVFRIPGTRILDAEGKDMEMNPRPVDQLVIRPIGESYAGKDSQLDAAVAALIGK